MSPELPYENSFDHILDELARLDIMLNAQIILFRRSFSKFEHTKNIFISDEEVNQIISTRQSGHGASGIGNNDIDYDENTEIERLKISTQKKQAEINERIGLSVKAGNYLPLSYLAHLFKLDGFEKDAIVICLAPLIDKKYERLYAYLNDNMIQKRPTVSLVSSLEGDSIEAKMTTRRILSKESNLVKYKILHVIDNDHNYDAIDNPAFYLDERIVNLLLGNEYFDPRIASFARLVRPQLELQDYIHDPDFIERIQSLLAFLSGTFRDNKGNKNTVVNLYGHDGSGRKTVAEVICKRLHLQIVVIDIAEVLSGGLDFEDSLILSFREALFSGAAIYLENFDALLENEGMITKGSDNSVRDSSDHGNPSISSNRYYSYLGATIKMIRQLSWLTFVETLHPWNNDRVLRETNFLTVEVRIPGYYSRKRLWSVFLREESTFNRSKFEENLDLDALANKFLFSPSKIRESLITARNLARATNVNNPVITMGNLYRACRSVSSQGLKNLAKKVTPYYTWDDMVLPPTILAHLKDICNAIKNKSKVYSDWGFDTKFSLGKGITALFTGESGTGKTMAAEVIAKELDLDLYKIDLSMIVSKYIGETEKNLNVVFRESEGSNSILFFDEADSLFGKRTEVKDSHDRYANIETNFLLQKIDEFEGISILSTNYRKNVDSAFMRRMQFIVDFPFPASEYRLEIWRKAFPTDAPVGQDIDFKFLANNLHLSGGNIKNIVINAAFLAANRSGPISMADIILASRREFEKIGKPVQRSEFGRYASMLDGIDYTGIHK